MGLFNSTKLFAHSPQLLAQAVPAFIGKMEQRGYQVEASSLKAEEWNISITKGGVFTLVVGMKTSLKLKIKKQQNSILAQISAGLFGKQIIPSLLSYFIFWPLVVAQIWGLIQQSKMDEEVFAVFESTLNEMDTHPAPIKNLEPEWIDV